MKPSPHGDDHIDRSRTTNESTAPPFERQIPHIRNQKENTKTAPPLLEAEKIETLLLEAHR